MLPTISHSPKPWILSPQQTPSLAPGNATRSGQPPAESYPKRLAGGYLFLLALLLILSGCASPATAQPEPFVIWEVDEIREPVHRTDYEIIQVPVFYPKEVRVEVPGELRHFETTAELKRWLNSKPIILVSGGDCDDFSMILIEEANKDGYYMFFYPDISHRHFKCCAIAGNNVYLIEPQNHEIELIMRVD